MGFTRPCPLCEQEIAVWEDQDGLYRARHDNWSGQECHDSLNDFIDYNTVFFVKGVWN